jgi:hypothetical protein
VGAGGGGSRGGGGAPAAEWAQARTSGWKRHCPGTWGVRVQGIDPAGPDKSKGLAAGRAVGAPAVEPGRRPFVAYLLPRFWTAVKPTHSSTM